MEHLVIDLDPVIFHIGSLQVRWYGLMYVIGFLIAGALLAKLSKEGFFKVPKKTIDSFITMLILGMFIGARVAYVFIYNWDHYSRNLSELFAVWRGGLSFHGALAGLVIAGFIFARKHKLHFFEVGDCMGIAGTLGLFFGRMGNFINGELYGRVTDAPWGMIFAGAGPYPRHPSQLYEGIFEGLVLFLLLFLLRKRVKYYGIITSIFFVYYGLTRYVIEFFREPDAQLGYYLGGTTTMGQILCFLMILVGIVTFLYARKKSIPVN